MAGAQNQGYAVEIEMDLRQELNCERFGLGGIVNSDHIRSRGFYHCMALVLSRYYSQANREMIDSFFNDNWDISTTHMDEIDDQRVDELMETYRQILQAVRA